MNLRIVRIVRCLLSFAVALAAGTALAGTAQQIDSHGTLHRVEAVWVGKPAVPILRHTMLRGDGTTSVVVVPGTNDAFVDTDPALAVDPLRGALVLAWSRNTGSGFAVYASRFDGSGWSAPLPVLDDPAADDTEPQIQITPSLVHLVAHQGADYARICLDPVGLQSVFGPEHLPTVTAAITPGVDPPTTPPEGSLAYFASSVIRPMETEPGEVVIWGVRDEPVPIDYVEAMVLPVDLVAGNTALAAPIEGSLTMTVTSPTHVWYTLFQDGGWSEFAFLVLDETTSVSEVRGLLADLIRRTGN